MFSMFFYVFYVGVFYVFYVVYVFLCFSMFSMCQSRGFLCFLCFLYIIWGGDHGCPKLKCVHSPGPLLKQINTNILGNIIFQHTYASLQQVLICVLKLYLCKCAQKGALFFLNNHVYETVPFCHWGSKIVPLRVPYYGQSVLLGALFRYPFFSE